MKAKFIGDPNDNFDGPRVFPFRGIDFPKGKWVAVADEATFAKCALSNHFETSGEAEEAAVEPAEPELAPESADQPEPALDDPEPAADPEPISALDHDADGKPGGSTASPEKAAIIAELEAIPGAEFDGRWGVPKLQAALEAARFMNGDDD